jgi:hypothetical protein
MFGFGKKKQHTKKKTIVGYMSDWGIKQIGGLAKVKREYASKGYGMKRIRGGYSFYKK